MLNIDKNECAYCSGRGWVRDYDDIVPCPKCLGLGHILKKEEEK